MSEFGKVLVGVGGLLVIFGLVLMLSGRFHLPIGRLPGDFVYRGRNTTFYFPIVTSIVLSVVLSVIFYIVGRIGR